MDYEEKLKEALGKFRDLMGQINQGKISEPVAKKQAKNLFLKDKLMSPAEADALW
jgi:hypothetical protein